MSCGKLTQALTQGFLFADRIEIRGAQGPVLKSESQVSWGSLQTFKVHEL